MNSYRISVNLPTFKNVIHFGYKALKVPVYSLFKGEVSLNVLHVRSASQEGQREFGARKISVSPKLYPQL